MKTKAEEKVSVAAVRASVPSNPNTVDDNREDSNWTIEDAFSWNSVALTGAYKGHTDELNLERGIRSVAFLLQYLSHEGSAKLDGMVAHALGTCLNDCANEASRLQHSRYQRCGQSN